MKIIGKLSEQELNTRQHAAEEDLARHNAFERMRLSILHLMESGSKNGFHVNLTKQTKQKYHIRESK